MVAAGSQQNPVNVKLWGNLEERQEALLQDLAGKEVALTSQREHSLTLAPHGTKPSCKNAVQVTTGASDNALTSLPHVLQHVSHCEPKAINSNDSI